LAKVTGKRNGIPAMAVMNKAAPTQHPASQEPDGNMRLPGMVEVNVHSAAEVDPALEEAIAAIRETAAHHRMGILVTRTGAGSYIVRAHPAVPCGLVRQQHG
jgi:hypothetical protein